MRNWLLFLLIILIGFACDSDGVRREIVDGVEVIHNPEYGLWQNKIEAPVKFELELTIGKEEAPEEETFAAIKYVFTDNDQNIYIYDREDYSLFKFRGDGTFLWKKGRQGEGPGEFRYVNGCATDGTKHIYFLQNFGRRIDRFNLDGQYIESFLIDTPVQSGLQLVGFIGPDKLIFSQPIRGEAGADIIVFKLDTSIQRMHDFRIKDDIGIKLKPHYYSLMQLNIIDNQIVAARRTEWEFQYYNIQGIIQKRVTRDFHYFIRDAYTGDNGFSMRIYSSLSAPWKVSDNLQICRAHWPLNVRDPDKFMEDERAGNAPEVLYKFSVDILNNKGELLYSEYSVGSVNEIGMLRYADGNGYVYTTELEPFPCVKKYKVIVRKYPNR